MEIVLVKNKVQLMKGSQEEVKEMIEEMVEVRLGLFLELQESTEDGEFHVYLHSDNFSSLSLRDIQQLKAMRITDSPELSTEGLKRLLNIDFQLVDTKSA